MSWRLWTTSTDGTQTNQDLFLLQNIEPRRSSAVGGGYCHGAGLGATILSSGVDVLADPRVSVALRVTRMRCHSDSVSPVSVPFRCVFWVSAEFCWVLRIGNHCIDSVAIKALSIVYVLMFLSFLPYATSCILDRLSKIQTLLLVPEPLVCKLFVRNPLALAQPPRSLESCYCSPICPVTLRCVPTLY